MCYAKPLEQHELLLFKNAKRIIPPREMPKMFKFHPFSFWNLVVYTCTSLVNF